MTDETVRNVYRVQGMTCAGCAGSFEKKVKELPGVLDAKVNFGAAKLTVYGETAFAGLEKAGEFDGLRLLPENAETSSGGKEKGDSLLSISRETLLAVASALLIAAGVVLGYAMPGQPLAANAVYAAAALIGGFPLFRKGLANLIALRFEMNTLMTIAIIGAAVIGQWGEAATVVLLFAISEALESHAMERARRSISSLMDLKPKTAIVRGEDGRTFTAAVADLAPGDTVIVKPGQSVPIDGVVLAGVSGVVQAAITGESMPVEKAPGSDVYAGTLNGEGLLEVRATRRANDTTLARIIHLVEEAQEERAPSQQLVDRFARWYTPGIMVFALGLAVIPPLFFGAEWLASVYSALAVLVVGCPCALVISTPVAIVTAIGKAARHGVLIKGGAYVEAAAKLSVIAFDKTGTLTEGKPCVTDIRTLGDHGEAQSLAIAAAMESGSAHPLGHALVQAASARELALPETAGIVSATGYGLQATVNGAGFRIGKPAWALEKLPGHEAKPALEAAERLQREGKTVVALASDTAAVALFGIADTVRASGAETVRQLARLGIPHTAMLTGDHAATAQVIAAQAGISDVRAALLPEEKLAAVRSWRQEGHSVAMIGDGVNDAPALAAANIGIAIGGAGSDAAMETADIVLMGGSLTKLPFLVRLSRRTLRVIRENIGIAFGLKAAALLLAVPGWLTLWMAIFADMGATLIVTLNALRLLGRKDG